MNKTTFRFGKNAIGKLLFTVLFIFTCQLLSAQVVIARQDFETSPATPTMTFTTSNIGSPGASTGFSTGTSGGGGSPANANLFTEGSRGYRVTGPTSGSATAGRTLIFSDVNTTGYTGISLSFRVAGMSIGSNTNGMDNTIDEVLIEVSPDGGTTWYQQAKVNVTGTGSNARWAFTATGTGTRAYAADNAFSSFSSNNNANGAILTGANAVTTATITGLPAVTNLKVRLSAQGNSVNESWILDDVRITGTLAPTGPTVTTTAATSVTTTGATLNGTIDANNVATDITFEYGTTVSYGTSVGATPSSLSDDTETPVSATIGSLALNTLYNYRTVGTVSGTPTNGNNITFYTLAATPGVVTVANPQLTTLAVTVNATTENSNPSATQYAIQETTGGLYVQANGSLGASAVWQTAATWATVTVTGLANTTTYTFQAKARNGANVETAFGGTASGTTLTPATVDWCNLQWPTSQTIEEGSAFTVYARVNEPGITNSPGEGTAIDAWIGYSATNGTPDGTWAWIPATYFGDDGSDNDEYSASLGAGITPGTYYYVSRFSINGGPFVYGGKNNAIWSSNTDSAVLTVNSNLVDFCNVQFPSTINITEGGSEIVYAQVYEPGVTNSGGQGAGISAWIGYSTTNGTPDNTWTWISATYNTDSGNNDEYQATLGTGLAPGTYYYASRFQKTGSTQYQYGDINGVWNTTADNGVMTIAPLLAPDATASTGVDSDSFFANWNAVSGATGYRLDVSTSPTFTAGVASGNTPWINEVHYDNNGGDVAEFIEVVVPTTYAGTGLTVTLYNGGNGTSYDTKAITAFTTGSSTANHTIYYYTYPADGVQNGAPDGFALSDAGGLIQFLSYEGTFTGSGGPANGVLSTNIGQVEGATTPVGYSLQLSGSGNAYADFAWQPEALDTPGDVNNGQSLTAPTAASPAFVPGYENLNVGDVTTYEVIGLDPETVYYYRVRAVNGGATSGNSDLETGTTLPAPVTWTGGAWSNVSGPTNLIDAIIEDVYVTADDGEFTAKSLTVTTGGSLTVSSDDVVTVVGALENELTSSAVVVENNGVLMQGGTSNLNTGSITVRRNSSAILRQDYTLWSSPVAGQGLYAFSPTTLPNRFYTYNTSTNLYSNSVGFNLTGLQYPSPLVAPNGINGTDTNNVLFATAKGYLIRTPWNHPTAPTVFAGQFAGVPNSGDITYTMSLAGTGFNLVGNPYPSPINMETFVNDNAANITTSLYFWRETNGNTSNNAYCQWNDGLFQSNGQSQVFDPQNVIRTGQGFFVEATGAGTALVFNNDQRVADTANQFFRQNSTQDVYWLNLTNADGAFSQAVVSYKDYASNGLDRYDGKNIGTSQVSLTSLIDGQEYGIQGKAAFVDTDVVPMHLKVETAGTYSVSIDHSIGVFTNGQSIYLKDNVLSSLHNLSQGAYSFTSEAGSFANRFEVVYRDAALGVDVPTLTEKQVVIYKNQVNDFVITTGNFEMGTVKVFDVRGRLLLEKQNINATQTTITAGLSNEVLLVQIATTDGTVVTKKVVR